MCFLLLLLSSLRSCALKRGTASHCSVCSTLIFPVNYTTLWLWHNLSSWNLFCSVNRKCTSGSPSVFSFGTKLLFLLSCQKLTKLGQFRVKDESPSSGPSLQPGSLFFSRDNATKSSTSLKGNSVYSDLPAAEAQLNSYSSF